MVTESTNDFDILLGPNQALNRNLAIAPIRRLYGNEPDIVENNVSVRIGSRPQVLDLVDLYKRNKRELPTELDFFADDYRLWMITHHVGVMQEPGQTRVRQLGFEVRLAEGRAQPEFTIVSVLPRTEFITRLSVDQKFECVADIDLGLGAKLPDSLTTLLDQFDGTSVKASAKLQLSNKTNLVGRLSFHVATPIVAAIGDGDTYSEWMLSRADHPLTGIHSFVQIALVPEVVKRVAFECRVSVIGTAAFGLFPDKRRSNWTLLQCEYPSRSREQLS